MACVGIVGGLGVGATVHYYEKIAAACKARGVVPDLVIVHADVDRGQGLVRDGKLDAAGRLSRRLHRAHGARRRQGGGDPRRHAAHLHRRADAAHRACPLINIVDADRRGAARAQDRARGAVRHDLHHAGQPVGPALRRRDREAAARRDRLRRPGLPAHPRQPARPTPTDAAGLRRIAAELQRRDGVEAILLAGTDLAVMFDETTAGFPAIDVARLHIDAIVERLHLIVKTYAARRRSRRGIGRHARRFRREALDLDLDDSADRHRPGRRRASGTRPRLARSSSARGSTPGSASASKQYRTVVELRLSARTADMERLLA